MMTKQYSVDWDVWNVQTGTYEPEGLNDFVYADSPEEAIEIMMDYIIENSDDWYVERYDDVLKLHHERYDRHEDRLIETDLEYRNFRIHTTD